MAPAVAAIGLGSTALGGIVGAVGAVGSGIAASSMYSYQAGIANMNAQIARQNAAYEQGVGEVQAQQSGMKTRAVIGATRAQQGASGLDVNSGTGVLVRSSEAELGSEDQAIIRNNAAYKAYGQEVLATQEEAQANLDNFASTTSLISGGINAFSSILGGGGSFASKWLTGGMVGLNGTNPATLPTVQQGGLF